VGHGGYSFLFTIISFLFSVEYNSDFRHDLRIGLMGELLLGKLLSNTTVEVKLDFGTHRTGNFYIEYSSRGRPSGIATTEADYWVLIAASEKGCRHKENEVFMEEDDILYLVTISTKRLKDLCRTKYERKNVPGGDENTSLGVLIKATDLL
jgi:hypothetical protein